MSGFTQFPQEAFLLLKKLKDQNDCITSAYRILGETKVLETEELNVLILANTLL